MVVEDAAGLTARVPLDHATGRVRRGGGDAGDLERQAVGGAIVATLLYDPDRVIGRDRVQVVLARQASLGDDHEVALDPLPLRRPGHSFGQLGLQFLDIRDLGRQEGHIVAAHQAHDLEVIVGVDQPGRDRPAAQIGNPRGLTDGRGDLVAGPHRLDQAIFDSHCLGDSV